MNNDRFGYIYKTTNKLNNKIYIGQHKHHTFDSNYYGSGKLIKREIKRLGKHNFQVEIICWCSTQTELDQAEIHYIKLFNSRDKRIGYNILRGGQPKPSRNYLRQRVNYRNNTLLNQIKLLNNKRK